MQSSGIEVGDLRHSYGTQASRFTNGTMQCSHRPQCTAGEGSATKRAFLESMFLRCEAAAAQVYLVTHFYLSLLAHSSETEPTTRQQKLVLVLPRTRYIVFTDSYEL